MLLVIASWASGGTGIFCRRDKMTNFIGSVVELVDTLDSKSCECKLVGVQVPPDPPKLVSRRQLASLVPRPKIVFLTD